MNSSSLSEIKVGKKSRVLKIKPQSSIRRRLMDMGIVPRTEVTVIGKAPMGDPIEVLVRGYKLTLRKSEARDVLVQEF